MRDKQGSFVSYLALREGLGPNELKQSQACGLNVSQLDSRRLLEQAGQSIVNIWSPVDTHNQADLVRINGETLLSKPCAGAATFGAACKQDFYSRLDWENSELEHYLLRNFDKSSSFKVELHRPANSGIENTRVKIVQEFSDPFINGL
jgi:hypothetical protein